ncbi:low affinity immunoglobulin epsilon Fc receptor-like isoform X1 [Oryzias latipes]|uniref:low affinity immunoglobulin epsilon Fc receptor-like isoform X1 n=1 Tax=Oryzias latipes TaxID=8090 RepID=UPI0009DB1851|nr:low affinity immunoglobulin epsilon Fc receptor-like isoform X1 [Oryzias latipes]
METKKLKLNLSDLEAKTDQLTLEKRDLQNQTEDLRMNMTKLDNQNQDLRVNMTKLENQTQQLNAEKMFYENQTKEMTVNMTILQNQNEQLRNNSDKLSKIQAAIIRYSNFPADLFCPDGVCQTCPKDWIQFQESCHFFYNLNSQWKTWDQSRQFCQGKKSDLVVISSQEEQTFIKSKVQYYYDTWHGYWIGLQKVNNWIWVDGSPDNLGYWNNPGSSENFTLIIQNAALTQSWIQNRNGFLNSFICEIKALIF